MYCGEVWGSTFTIPEDENLRGVKLEAWRDALGDLNVNLVRRALVGSDSHFALTPYELRVIALERARAERGELPRPSSDQALEELHRLIARYGYTRPVEALAEAERFDPALLSVVRSIGWLEICKDENPGVFRGQFRVLYESARERHERECAPLAPALAEFAKTLMLEKEA
jgi:hypothetical protein